MNHAIPNLPKLLATLLFNLLLLTTFAQLHVGYYHDLDKLPIHDYAHPIDYTPETKLIVTHYSDSYEEGKIYYADGSTADGLIRFENKQIWHKQKPSDKQGKLNLEEVLGLKIGLDSFFVANNFHGEQKVASSTKTTQQFMQYLATIEGKVFAKHYFYSSGIAQQYTMTSAESDTYKVSTNGGKSWVSFPRKKKSFKAVALQHFGHVPYLKRKIEDESIGFDDVLTLIKSLDYYEALQTDETLYFDSFWNELIEPDNATYQAKVLSLESDSIWTIDYFQGDRPLYRGRFHSLFPHKKHGDFEILGDGGLPLIVSSYKENELKSKKVYHADGLGKLHYEYNYGKAYDGYNSYSRVYFKEAYDATGASIKNNESWQETISFKQGEFTNSYNGETLVSSYRLEDGKQIHQVIDPSYKLKAKKMQTLANTFFANKNFLEAAKQNAEGLYLISVQLTEKGKVAEVKVLNSLTPTVDEKIRFFARRLGHEYHGIKFKAYKVGKEKVQAEFVIPLQFSIAKFYRKPASYYYDWHLHHMMFHQQMMMQPMNLPTPPPMPRF